MSFLCASCTTNRKRALGIVMHEFETNAVRRLRISSDPVRERVREIERKNAVLSLFARASS